MEKIEVVPMTSLVLDNANARKGNVAAIADSLREFGQHRAVVAQKTTGRIIAGNHLFMAAQMLGWHEIGVFWVEDDDIKAIRRGIADNATGDLAVWDLETLGELVEQVGDDIPGLDLSILDGLVEKGEPKEQVKPIYPVVAKFSEHYNCAIIFATDDIEWAYLVTALQLDRCKSYKNTKIGQSHVVTAERFIELWRSRRSGAAQEGDEE